MKNKIKKLEQENINLVLYNVKLIAQLESIQQQLNEILK